jgi:hypothetical protein
MKPTVRIFRLGLAVAGALLALAVAQAAAASAATFNVNTTSDVISSTFPGTTCATGGSCSLREAVIESNHTAGPNTINVPAGTYTLTLQGAKGVGNPTDTDPNIPNSFSSQFNELDIENQNVSIVGAGAGSTIVQPATSAATSQNMIFIVNGFASTEPAPLNVTISGLTMRFGRNPYSDTLGGMWGFGGALEWESGDGGHLTLSNDVFDQNATVAADGGGDGGAVAGFNSSGDTKPSILTVTGSTFTNNTSPSLGGGGLFTSNVLALSLSGSSFSNNTAHNGGAVFGFGFAAGTPAPAGTPPSTITNSTFTNNTAAAGGSGGGVAFSNGISISGSTFTGNTAGEGGGLVSGSGSSAEALALGYETTVTGSTFTGNSATATTGPTSAAGGGAIANSNGILNVTDSRITGNTTAQAGTGSGIDQGPDNGTDRVTATDDWWGCNAGPGTPAAGAEVPTPGPGCDSVADRSIGTHSFVTAPFVTLRTTASPSTIQVGTSSTLTTSFLKDSAGNALTTTQIGELIGLPITWSATHGTISNSTATIQSNGTATATLNSDNTCNNTTGEAAVDHVQPADSLATATLTVQCPNLTATKSDDVSHSVLLGNSFNWTIDVANSGPGFAAFASGQTVLSDDLPTTGTYGTPTVTPVSGITGTVTCSIASNKLTCIASGPVQLASGASLKVAFSAKPSVGGDFSNPPAGGACSVDPSGVVVESNETDNACSDQVTVVAPDLTATKTDNVSNATTLGNSWNWKLHVANGGNGTATFTSGQTIVHDDLPSGPTYGTPTVSGSTGITGTGSVNCGVSADILTCTASNGTVIIGATTGAFDVNVPSTPTAIGTYTNPAPSGGSCMVDPANVILEGNETNNTCGPDSVTVTAPDLTVGLSDDTGHATTLGHSWNWNLHINNGGNAPATFASGQTILSDDLPNIGLTYGTPSVANTSGVTGASNISCSVSLSNTLTCIASGGSVTIPNGTGSSFDVSVPTTPAATGTYDNPRSTGVCSVDPNSKIVESDETNNVCSPATDSVTVTAPDLTVASSDDTTGPVTLGGSWNWKLHVANSGSASSSDASFASGDTIVSDDLPSSGLTYGTPSVTNTSGLTGTGQVACSIASNTLTCTASGGSVTIPAGQSFDLSVQATPAASGTFDSPRSGGTCSVDPGGVVTESDETNNACSPATDSVTVIAPDLTATGSDDTSGSSTLGNSWNWKLHVANIGSSDARFANGDTIVSDDLPSSGLTYGTPSVTNTSGLTGTGQVSCSIASNTLTCTANGGPLTIPAGQSFDISVQATPSTPGTFTNPRSGGACSVDPSNKVLESDETNNACSADTVVISSPDLTAVASNDTSGLAAVGHAWNWKLEVGNGGNADAAFADGQTIVSDDLPTSGLTYGTPSATNTSGLTGTGHVSCSIASSTLTCTAGGGSVTIPAGQSFDISVPTTSSTPGTFTNPRPGGACSVDPNNNVVESDETNNACSDTVTVVGAPTAQISAPADNQSYTTGTMVPTSFSCSEAANGLGIASCLDSQGKSSPAGTLDTSKTGTFAYTVIATSKEGLTSTAVIHYTVVAPKPPSNTGTPGKPNGQPGNNGLPTGSNTLPAVQVPASKVAPKPDGTIRFQVKLPGPGSVNVLVTAWKFAELPTAGIAGAALLQPAPHRFVFARKHLKITRGGVTWITIRPNRRGLRLIAHHKHEIRLRIWVTYASRTGQHRKIGLYNILLPTP